MGKEERLTEKEKNEKIDENKWIKIVAGLALILLPVLVAYATANNQALGVISFAAGWSILWSAVLVFLAPLIGIYLIYGAVCGKKIVLN